MNKRHKKKERKKRNLLISIQIDFSEVLRVEEKPICHETQSVKYNHVKLFNVT